MKKIIKTLGVVLALAFGLTSCQEEVRQLEFTDKGPNMTVNSYTTDVYMGGDIQFSVTLNDDKFALSTLKAYLMFEGTTVSEFYLRTKEYGTYEGNLINCPLLAKIGDGQAELKFVAQNVGMGITEQVVNVNVKRPDMNEITLVSGEERWAMKHQGNYVYTVAGNFPADFPATVEIPTGNAYNPNIVLGWANGALTAGSTESIPFSMGTKGGEYEVSVDLFNLTAAPFNTLNVPISESNNVIVHNLIQGATLNFDGIPEAFTWDWDFDYFAINEDNTITFKAINGTYRLAADYTRKFIRVDMWNPETNDYARMNLDNYAASAIYAIGQGIGKPTTGPAWNTTDGAWCLAQHEPNVYQITFVAGKNLPTTGLNWKIFECRGWDGNFGYSSRDAGYAVIADDGNVSSGSMPLESDQGYTFKFDLTGGKDAVVFTVEEVDVPVSGLDIRVNGTAAAKVSATLYRVPVMSVKKGDALSVSGVDMAGWYLDPDYITADGKFAATDGYYSVDLDLAMKYVKIIKVKENGDHATLDDGALWMMAWGLAHPVMTQQFAFNPGTAYCMAEISPKVFQLTGVAVEETDGTTMGGRFRYDYISAKYFHQDGWGGEMVPGNIVFDGNAADLLSAPGNIELAEGKQLELGATYRMTVDLTDGTVEKVTFEKL